MTDVFTAKKRSQIMARIKGRGNRGTELALARLFRSDGVTGWRRQYAIMGRPDFAFPRARVAVFVDGCFWHRCRKCRNVPDSNREFWQKKLAQNVRRDRTVNRELRRRGWKVVRVWEHEFRKPKRVLSKVRCSLDAPPHGAKIRP